MLGFGARKFPDPAVWYMSYERQLLACYYWALIETVSVTEAPKIILKPELCILSLVMSQKHSDKEISTMKSFIIKWKWSTQEYAPGGMTGGSHCIREWAASFLQGQLWNQRRSCELI